MVYGRCRLSAEGGQFLYRFTGEKWGMVGLVRGQIVKLDKKAAWEWIAPSGGMSDLCQ